MPEITQSRLDELEKQADWLSALESAGVDNWQGIDFAYEIMRDRENEDKP